MVVLARRLGHPVEREQLDLAVARGPPGAAAALGVVLVSPATSWDKVWLGRRRRALAALPTPLLGLALGVTGYQLLDVGQVTGAAAAAAHSPHPMLNFVTASEALSTTRDMLVHFIRVSEAR